MDKLAKHPSQPQQRVPVAPKPSAASATEGMGQSKTKARRYLRGRSVGGSGVCAGQRGVAVDEGAVCAAHSGGSRGNSAHGTGTGGPGAAR
jgi:hypothetical protein